MFKSSIRGVILKAIEPKIKQAETAYEEDKKVFHTQFQEGVTALNENLVRQKETAFNKRVDEALGVIA